MASTYVNNLRLNEMATGDASGTWGTVTNTNLELIGEALGYNTQNCFSSDADATTTVADGATDPARAFYFKVTSSATLTATRTLTIAPNTVSRVMIIENATTGSQSIAISQGSGANVTVPTGEVKMVYLDGAGSGAAVTDGFANLKVTDAAQTNITSVGTLTSLTVSGDATFDTSTLKVDSSNNRVGIGTASPSELLHVSEGSSSAGRSSDADTLFLENNGNAGITIGSSTTGTGSVRFADSGGTGRGVLFYDHSSDFMSFHSAGNERMRIDSSGKLLVGDTASHTTDLLQIETPASGGGHGIQIRRNDANTDQAVGHIMFGNNTDTDLVKISAKTDGDSNAGDSGALLFSTQPTGGSNTERMRIDSSGMLGLGTTPPTDSHTGWNQFFIGQKGSLISENATGTHGLDGMFITDNLYVDSDTGSFANIETNESSAYRQEAGVHIFYSQASGTAGAAVTLSEKMRIDSSGNVLLNQTTSLIGGNSSDASDNKSVMINGGGSTSDSRGAYVWAKGNEFSSEGGFLRLHAGNVSGAAVAINTAGSERMRIDSSGNVGIGTTSPSAMLHLYKATGSGALEPELIIENNHNTSSETDGAGRLTFYSDDSNNSGIPDNAWLGQVRFMGDDKDGVATEFEYAYMVGRARDPGSGTGRKGGVSFFTRDGNSMTETVTITQDSVGIGTTSPSDELHVKGGSGSAFIRVDNSADGYDTGFNIYQNGSRKWEIHSDDSNSDALDFRPGGTQKFTMTQTGRFGIGTTSPSQVLHVVGKSYTTQQIGVLGAPPATDIAVQSGTNTSGDYWRFGGNSGANVGYFINDQNDGVQIAYGGTSWSAHSDERIKENIVLLGNVLPEIDNLRCVKYNRKGKSDTKIGFIAQDWEASPFSEVVDEDTGFVIESDGSVVSAENSESTDSTKMMSYTETIPVLLKAIQELKAENASLKTRIEALEA